MSKKTPSILLHHSEFELIGYTSAGKCQPFYIASIDLPEHVDYIRHKWQGPTYPIRIQGHGSTCTFHSKVHHSPTFWHKLENLLPSKVFKTVLTKYQKGKRVLNGVFFCEYTGIDGYFLIFMKDELISF